MLALDLFNTDYERRLMEGGVDTLEQRRIDDLAMRMDELVARAKEPAYQANPGALAGLKKEFQKLKDERDSYYKVREGGIPGNIPTEKIPGKEDLLKGKGRTYYEDQKKNSDQVNEYISMGSDKNYQEAEPYKNYRIYVRKKPFGNTGMYTAHTEIDRKEFMGKGPSQEEAVQAARDRIDFVLNAQKKVTGSSTIDFNVKFATDLLADPRQTFYAKLEKINGEPKLVIASPEVASDPELLAAGDFKRSALRNQVDDSGRATPLPGIPLTAKGLRSGEWIANGRYTVGKETQDRDGNRVFDLTYHSTAHTKSDKLRLNQPAFTLGTAREVDEHGGGIGPRQHWQDLMPEQMNPEDYDDYEDEEETDLRSGDYVRDRLDGVHGEIFRMQGDPYERRVRILDRDGKGWYIEPSRLTRVDPQDPDVQRYFGKKRVRDLDEAISKKDLLSRVAKDLNSDEFKNAPVDPNKSFTKGDHWQGAKPGDYGYTGYQGHGMPVDKKKGVKETATAPIIVPKRKKKEKPEPKFDIPYSADDYVPPALAMASAEALDRIIADPSTKETTRELAKKARAEKKKGVAEGVDHPYDRGLEDGLAGKEYNDSMYSSYEDKESYRRGRIVAKQQVKKGVAEGWSDAMVARRTGGPRTPYSVYIKGRKWKDFENEDLARAVMNKLKAKFRTDGRDPETITIAPTDMSEGVAEAVTDVRAGMAEIYRRLAPKIERYKDSFLAGQLYDELENYAELHGAETEFKRMMNGARNRAHMEYDTNPGGFHNWFWFLPFGDEITEEQDTSGVESAIIRRIMVAHVDWLQKFGPEKVMQAAEEVAYNVGDVDEIGTSDVSAYVHEVGQILGVDQLNEKWSQKYKSSINCASPKGFSQRAHCAGKKK